MVGLGSATGENSQVSQEVQSSLNYKNKKNKQKGWKWDLILVMFSNTDQKKGHKYIKAQTHWRQPSFAEEQSGRRKGAPAGFTWTAVTCASHWTRNWRPEKRDSTLRTSDQPADPSKRTNFRVSFTSTLKKKRVYDTNGLRSAHEEFHLKTWSSALDTNKDKDVSWWGFLFLFSFQQKQTGQKEGMFFW